MEMHRRRKTVLEDIISAGKRRGGMTLEEFGDFATDGKACHANWKICLYGKHKDALIEEFVDCGWDDSLLDARIEDIHEHVMTQRNKELNDALANYLNTKGIVVEPGRELISVCTKMPSDGFGGVDRSAWREMAIWLFPGTNTPGAYDGTGFDMEKMPMYQEILFDENTGEVLGKWMHFVASGEAFAKVEKDFGRVAPFFGELNDRDREFPAEFKEMIVGVDPFVESYPDKMFDFIEVVPRYWKESGLSLELLNALSDKKVDPNKPYGLTPAGRIQKNPISVTFESTPSRGSVRKSTWTFTYSAKGNVVAVWGAYFGKKRAWHLRFEDAGIGLELVDFERFIG